MSDLEITDPYGDTLRFRDRRDHPRGHVTAFVYPASADRATMMVGVVLDDDDLNTLRDWLTAALALGDDDTRAPEEIALSFRDTSARLAAEQPLPPDPECPKCGKRAVFAASWTVRVCGSCGHRWEQT